MGKSNTSKHGKSDAPVKKKKGRPKKKTSKLNSPSRQIEKEERKRGRPRKNTQSRKTDPAQLTSINRIHQNSFTKPFPHPQPNEDNEAFVPTTSFDLPIKGQLLNEELREEREMYEEIKNNNIERNVMTRRDLRSMKKEAWPRALSMEERMSQMEEMISSLGMMIFALHKKNVNKDKKLMIDEHIRSGYNIDTARVIRENLTRDPNYFDKTRRNSIHYPNESMAATQGSVKQ